jgi:co-chaperonin GroES (HSP10)
MGKKSKLRHPADTYKFKNGSSMRLLRNDVLVQIDAAEERSASGLVHFPEGAMEHVYATGKILAFGWIKEIKRPNTTKTRLLLKPIPIPGLEIGQKCCFTRFLKEQHSNKHLREKFEDNIISLKTEDILFVYTGEIELG